MQWLCVILSLFGEFSMRKLCFFIFKSPEIMLKWQVTTRAASMQVSISVVFSGLSQ
jgi:hypothetical protein